MQTIRKDPTVEHLLSSDPEDSDAPQPSGDDDPRTDSQTANRLEMPVGSSKSTPPPPIHPSSASGDTALNSDEQNPPEKGPLASASKASLPRHSIRRRPHPKDTREDDLKIIQTNLSTRYIKPVILPLAYLLGGLVLAIGHHFFNSWANGQPIGSPTRIPQVWVLRVGTAFAFGFQTILAASLGFAICQLLWFSTRRKYLTVQDINTLYLVERRDLMSTVVSNAVKHGPFLVGASLLSFLLPIAAVFTPASLGVTATTYGEDKTCVIAAADLNNMNFSGVPRFFDNGPCDPFNDVSVTVARMSEITFSSGTPTPLPEYCGGNCTYTVPVDSVAYKCEEGVQLPPGHMGNYNPATDDFVPTSWTATVWNASTDGDPKEPNLPLYVGWHTGSFELGMDESVGTNGSAYCTPVYAHYEFTVQTLNGMQSVSYDVTTGDKLPLMMVADEIGCRHEGPNSNIQLTSIIHAVRRMLLGSLSFGTSPAGSSWHDNSTVRLAPFLNITAQGMEECYIWGDVVRGIEQLPANITATLLNLDNGRQNSTCSYIHSDIVYDYHPTDLWIPYGVAILVVALALIFGVFVFLRFNPDNLTTSFADTISITRNTELDDLARKCGVQEELESQPLSRKFRLGEMPSGYMGYGTEHEF